MSIGQALSLGGSLTLVGMGVVFTGLILLVFITWAMSRLIRAFKKEAIKPAAPALSAAGAPIAQLAPQMPKGDLAAVLAASIATAIGGDVARLRIHSIRRVGQNASETAGRELSAVVAAAISTAIDQESGGLRIHSIRKIN